MRTNTLRDVSTAAGPVASVYLDTTHDTADATKRLELVWRALREELAGQGAEEQLLGVLDDALTRASPPAGPGGRAVLAAGDRVLLDEALTEPPAADVARLSTLPYLVPLLRHGNAHPSHLRAEVDQVGVTITLFDERGRPGGSHSAEGSTHHDAHKVRGGGFAHRDLQSHTEEVIRQNLQEAADEITAEVERSGVSLVVLAGEPRTRAALQELLPQRVARITRPIDTGGRASGASDEVDRAVFELLAGQRLARADEIVERFRQAGPNGLAVQGIGPVTAELRESNVDTLLVGDPGAATVWTDGAGQLGGAQELEALGVRDPERIRADEAIPAAALARGADLVAVDERLDVEDGFGALLRHG